MAVIKVLNNATNGDVIKALFDGEYGTNGNMVMIWGNKQGVSFTLDWWNTPYKVKSER